MNQKFALILAGVLTAFFLVMVGSIATMIIAQPSIVQPSVAQPIQSQPILSGQTNVAASTISTKLNSDQVVQIALSSTPHARLTAAPELVSYQGTVAYEVKLNSATLYIDANTGKVLATSNSNLVSPQNALSTKRRGEHIEREEKEND